MFANQNLVFTRASGSGFAAGFRGIRTGQWITLDVQNCDFKNLRTKAMGGSAIYVPLVKGDMSIDGDSTFTSNIVDTKCANMENDKFCEYGVCEAAGLGLAHLPRSRSTFYELHMDGIVMRHDGKRPLVFPSLGRRMKAM
jgi:hypothetical protein